MAVIRIDDRGPKINYTGTWNLGGTANEYDGTVSSSIKVGDHFSVPFTGTSIGVYGTFDSSSAGVQTSYEIDGGQPTTVPSRSSAQDSHQQLFWKSDPVRTGPHTLVVRMVKVNNAAKAGEGTVWFDYFNVTHAVPASASPPKKASHAALIGGVTAGVVVLIIAAALLLVYFRRKRTHRSSLSATSITALPAPSLAPMSESGPLAASSGKRRPNPNSGTVPNTLHTPAQSSYGPSESGTQSQSHGPSSAVDNTDHSRSGSVADLKRRQQQAVSSYEAGINGRKAHAHSGPLQHVDSGVRELTPAAPESGGLAELPPVYTAT